MEQDGSSRGQGGAFRLGREGPVPLTAPSGGARGRLSVSPVCPSFSCLSVTSLMLLHPPPGSHSVWPPRLLTCGLKGEQGARRSGPNAEPSAREGWGMKAAGIRRPASFAPKCGQWALLPAFGRGDDVDQAQRSVGRADRVSFRVGALSFPLCPLSRDPGTDRLSALRPLACASGEGTDCRRAIGAAQEGKTVARLPVRVAELETMDT